jgi:hypothetical protein
MMRTIPTAIIATAIVSSDRLMVIGPYHTNSISLSVVQTDLLGLLCGQPLLKHKKYVL